MSVACPIHGTQKIRPGNKGGYFCAAKMPDGSWCKEKPTAQADPDFSGKTAPANGSAAPAGDVAIKCACLNFAATMFRGGGKEMASEAEAVAKWIYHEWKGL